jgi:excisionase family DNA binding protein
MRKIKQIERFLSIDEVAEFLGVNRRTVQRLVQKGLPGYKLGQGQKARRIFDPSEVKAWIKKNYRQRSPHAKNNSKTP